MFEAKQISVDTVVAAAPGYVLVNFSVPLGVKLTVQTVNDIVNSASYPVMAWRAARDKVEPLSFTAADTSAARFVFAPNGKIFSLDGPPQCWSNYDLWQQWTISTWRAAHPITSSPRPVAVVTR